MDRVTTTPGIRRQVDAADPLVRFEGVPQPVRWKSLDASQCIDHHSGTGRPASSLHSTLDNMATPCSVKA